MEGHQPFFCYFLGNMKDSVWRWESHLSMSLLSYSILSVSCDEDNISKLESHKDGVGLSLPCGHVGEENLETGEGVVGRSAGVEEPLPGAGDAERSLELSGRSDDPRSLRKEKY